MHEKVLALALVLGVSPGCIRTHSTVEVKPVEVKPIHITLDVNLRVAKELDSFFDDLDAADPTLQTPAPK
ncbi:MAG: YnbE family lipoprotein [Lentisphaerae bacterium]|nr:YnbE family lipoprotein [Lentisphaerota bacterium]